MVNKSVEQIAFDNFVMRFDDDITVNTARRLADELGVNFDPQDFDH